MNSTFRCLTLVSVSLAALSFCPAATAQPAEDSSLYDRLTDEATAAALALSDDQKASVATIVSEREAALAAAENDEAKAGINADAQTKLSALLTDDQQKRFSALFRSPRIRFNFRFQKWADVLTWLAGEAGLSLVMEEAPEGTFNYSDRREYAPDEAIDLLNGWLLIKGFTLVRRDQLLMCISLKDGIPDGTVPRVTLEDLPNRGRSEFVSVLIPLEARDPETVMSEIDPLVSAWGEAKPLAATKQVLVTDAADIVRTIERVVEQIPPPKTDPKPTPQPAPKPELKVYPVQHANPEKAGEVIKELVAGSLVVDAEAGQISINAIPAEQAKVQAIIDQLEANQGQGKKAVLKSYSVRTSSPDQLVESVGLAVPAASLRYDSTTGRLVAFGSPEDQQQVTAALLELETQATATEDQLNVHRLQQVDPTVAQQLISSVLPDVRVTIDQRTDTLIAVGRLADLRAVKTLLDQLQPKADEQFEPVLQAYPVRSELVDVANAMITSVVPDAAVTPDPGNQRLLVVAQPKDQTRIADTLIRLKEDVASDGLQLKSYSIDGLTYAMVSPLLQTLVPKAQLIDDSASRRMLAIASAEDHEQIAQVLDQARADADVSRPQLQFYATPEDFNEQQFNSLIAALSVQASVTIDEPNNRLMITASSADHEKIAGLLEQIVPENPAEKPQLRSYRLPEQIDAQTFTSMLASVAKKAQVQADPANERLLITATEADHAAAAQLLDQLSMDLPDTERQLKTYPLPEQVSPDTISSTLSILAPNATVTMDASQQQILVLATDRDQTTVAGALEQLGGGPDRARRELKSYPLNADVDLSTVTSLLATLVPGASVTPDTTGHRLLITANAKDHASAEAAIAQIARDARGELPELEYYPLERADGDYSVGVLSAIVPSATIRFERESQRLSVIASPSDHNLLKQTLAKLESAAPETEKRTLKVYNVTRSQRTRFNAVLQGLTEEIPGLQVLADGEPDEMIVWAKPSHHEIVSGVLAQLDPDVPADQKPSLVVYPITVVEAESVAEVLTEIFPDATINIDSKSSRLLVRARPDLQKTIKSAIEQLDADVPEGREIKLMVYPVKGLNADSTLSLINEELPRVTVIRDDTAQTFIIRGRLEEHQKVAELLETLRSSPVGKRISAVYPSFHSDPDRAREFFQRAFPEADVVVDRATQTLTVIATVEDQQLIKETVDGLAKAETEGARAAELKTYSVPGVSLSELRSMLAESVPRARTVISGDQLLAWAQPADQIVIGQIVDGLQDATDERTVTAFDVSMLDTATAQNVLSTVAPQTSFLIGQNGRALIATVDAETKTKIEAALAQLADSPAAVEKPSLKFYPVDRATASSVQSVLASAVPEVSFLLSSDGSQLFARVTADQHARIETALVQLNEQQPFASNRILKMYSIAKSGPMTSTVLQRMLPSSIVSAGATPQQLMVEATASEHERVAELMAQLEEAASDSTRQLQFYDVNPAALSSTQTTLATVVPEVSLSASADSTRLIAHVTEEQHEKIQAALEQLAAEQPFESNRTLKVYSIAKTGSSTSAVLQRMVPGAVVNAGTEPNQLLIEATAADHERLAALVAQLETAAGDTARQLHFYQVDSASVQSIRSTLAAVVPQVTLTASTDNTRLIAHVTDEQHQQITEALDQLTAEQPFRSNRILKFYSVAGIGTNTAAVVTRLVPSAVVSTGTHAGQLMVEATPAQHEEISLVIDQLQAAAQDDNLSVRFYAVDDGHLDNTRSVIAAVVPEVALTASADSTRLIAVVNNDQHAKIISALESLAKENPFRSNRTLKFYSTADTGTDTMTVLQRMVPAALINAGSQADQLMIEATDAEHTEIEELMTSLRSAASDDARSLKHYDVARDELTNAQSIVTTAVPGVNIMVSADGTRLIALVTDEQNEKISTTLQELATAAEGAPRKTTSVFDISGTDPEAIEAALQPFSASDPEVQITVDGVSRRVYVHAFEDRQEEIRNAVTEIMSGVQDGAGTLVAAYFVGDGNGDEAQDALSALFPDATIVTDRSRRVIIATATPEQHEHIKTVAEQMKDAAIVGGDTIPRTYPTKYLDSTYLERVLRNLFPRDREFVVSVNPDNAQVVAVCKPEQHEIIAALLQDIDQPPEASATTLKVYKTAPMAPNTVIATLEPLVSRNTTLSSERNGDELVVSAPAEEQERIAELLQQMGISTEEPERTLGIYRVAPLDTRTVITALEPMVSGLATLSADRTGQEVVVSAPPEEQKKIGELIEQMRSHRTKVAGVQIRSYETGRGQADDVLSVLRPMFPDATLVTDRRNGVLVATAMPEEHETIEEVVRQMTGRASRANQPHARSYLMRQYDGNKMLDLLNQSFTSTDDVRINWDDRNKRIIAIATDEQHDIIETIVSELDPKEGPLVRYLKEYRLHDLDLGAVNHAVNGAVRHVDPGASVSLDFNGEKLIVTTNPRGHEVVGDVVLRFSPYEPKKLRIFQLTFMSPWEAHSAIDRMISRRIYDQKKRPDVHADDNLSQLWVRASDEQLQEIEELLIQLGEKELDGNAQQSSGGNMRVIPIGNDIEAALKRIEEAWPRMRPNPLRILTPNNLQNGPAAPDERPQQQSVPAQFSVPAEETDEEVPRLDLAAQDSIVTREDLERSAQQSRTSGVAGTAPVIVIPGNGRVTIASDDTEALDQLESLLRSMYTAGTQTTSFRDFAVVKLRNTAANDVAATIQEILDAADDITYFGDIAVVPEARLNALIVYGNRSDRRRLEPLLEILDSEKFDNTRAYRTKLLPLRYSSASRVEDVLQSIYRIQMTAGGPRSSLGIPSGVPSEVATVLRQINAAASAPLLTIETQRETNSLIIKAPQDLLDEVIALATELDEAVQTNRANGVTLLPLEKASSRRVMEMLRNVLN